MRGTVPSVTVAPAAVYTDGDKPVITPVTSNGRYPKSAVSNLNEIGKASFTGITTKDVRGTPVAQTTPVSNEAPARIANIWGGFDHRPTESPVQRAEQARGVAPDVKDERREVRILRQLDQQLLKSSAAATGSRYVPSSKGVQAITIALAR